MAARPFPGPKLLSLDDAGTFRLRVRAPTGTRIEQTAKLVDEVEAAIRRQIPANEMEGILEQHWTSGFGYQLELQRQWNIRAGRCRHSGFTETQSQADSELCPQSASESEPRVSRDNLLLPAADIVSQTLNFGLPAPLDIQVVGRNETVDQQVANSIAQKIRQVRGAVDVRVQQPNDLQRFEFNVDRTKAMELGLAASAMWPVPSCSL